MRRLILMRHAKSKVGAPDQQDRERPLNGRGRRSAAEIGAWLKARDLIPGAALVSDATRARETWEGLSFAFVRPDYLADLYHGSPETMLAVLRRAPDAECVLMLGHQPGISLFARKLLAEAPQSAQFEKYPTAATAVIELDVGAWRDVGWGGGRLDALATPRTLE